MIYVGCKNKNQLKQEVYVKDYYRVVKIRDGYICFNNSDEFDRWVQDNPPTYRVIKI